MDKETREAQRFTIQAEAKVMASLEIFAKDWDDALLQAKALDVPDFATPIEGDVFDNFEDFEITGIFK